MNPHQLLRLFPNASKSVLSANAADYGTGQPDLSPERPRKAAKPQHDARGPLARSASNKAGDRQRFHVRITSVRRRLIDEDNLVGKFHCDLLRYSGILPSDAPGICHIETMQRKAAKGEEETVEIEVYLLQ